MAKKKSAQDLVNSINDKEGFTIPMRNGEPYEDADQLKRNELIGEVNRLSYIIAVLTAKIDQKHI